MAGKKPKKKERKEQVNGNKKNRALVFAGVTISVIAIILLIVFLSVSRAKSYGEIEKALSQAGYSIYYRFNNNTYDKNGFCYKYDYSKRDDCKREIGVNYSESATITAFYGDTEKTITAYFNLMGDNTTKDDISISVEKELSEGKTFYRVFDKRGKNDYLWLYDSEGQLCYRINAIENNQDNYKICNGENERALFEYQNEVDELLKKMGLTKDDLLFYFNEYAGSYVKPKYEEAKKTMEKQLSYEAIKKRIKEAGYSIKKMDDGGVTISDYKSADYYSMMLFFFNNDTFSFSYSDWMYNNYMLLYSTAYDHIVGTDKESSCYYVVGERSELEDIEDRVILDKYCSDKDKREIDSLYNWFKYKLIDIGITRDELFSFAKDYDSKQ